MNLHNTLYIFGKEFFCFCVSLFKLFGMSKKYNNIKNKQQLIVFNIVTARHTAKVRVKERRGEKVNNMVWNNGDEFLPGRHSFFSGQAWKCYFLYPSDII